MSKSYQATGINLKAVPLGESDLLLTILTKEYGLIRAVAGGARKHRSAMAGRSSLFVINELQISHGRSIDRIKQAEMVQSFVGLGKTLAKLTAAQYLLELTIMQALSAQPQEELFVVLVEHLERLQQAANQNVLAHLVHGVYHLLAIAGFAPQVHSCCISQKTVTAKDGIPHWKAGFSITGGGVIALEQGEDLPSDRISHYLNANEIKALQELAQTNLPEYILQIGQSDWLFLEKLLRAYAQYHFDRPIQSSALIDNCFLNI
ncbi:MAG: DNA repair protein RecO [Pseudanabaenaceae cyanobacterium bins.39]|nr:DNA repair protein RecO [Pseudanabaenaceae cyanobacterium bins.39]